MRLPRFAVGVTGQDRGASLAGDELACQACFARTQKTNMLQDTGGRAHILWISFGWRTAKDAPVQIGCRCHQLGQGSFPSWR